MMTSRPLASKESLSNSSLPLPLVVQWERLERELWRSFMRRAVARTSIERSPSVTDDVTTSIQRAREALAALMDAAARGEVDVEGDDNLIARIVSEGYAWCLRVAYELETIEYAELEPSSDWARLERFAPQAVASFDTSVSPLLLAPRTGGSVYDPTFGVRRRLEEVCRFFDNALRSLAVAA